jgi:hypothetical protein
MMEVVKKLRAGCRMPVVTGCRVQGGALNIEDVLQNGLTWLNIFGGKPFPIY